MTTTGQLLQIAQLGHSVLRTKTNQIKFPLKKEVKQLIQDLKATVMDVDGVGIAAPQVYQSCKLFIIASHPNARYPYAPNMPPTAIINPKIISHSQKTVKDWEGCLSLPGIRALVPRFQKISVSYLNEKGQKIKTEYTDFLARIFQHEYDHLNGLVFLDRLESNQDIYMEKEFQKLIKLPPKK